MGYEPRPDLLYAQLQELKDLVYQLLTQSSLGYSAITEGALRVASEEGLIVEGSAVVTGLLQVIGRLQVIGLGILEVGSLIDLTGLLRVNAGGAITIGDIRIEGGKIYVGSGAAQIIIDGATGRILAGGMEIDPTDGGSVTFPGGAVVTGFTGGGVMMKDGDSTAVVSEGLVRIALGATGVWIDGFGLRVTGMPTVAVDDAPDGAYIGAVISDPFGMLRRVVA